MGFNLHASPAIEAHDREGLERILRYMGRPLYHRIDFNRRPMITI